MNDKNSKQQDAITAVNAYHTLKFDGLLSDKEEANISKKIKTKYGKQLGFASLTPDRLTTAEDLVAAMNC